MARGWESKEIESQIEAARERTARSPQPQPSPEEIARQRERESLELSRIRVLADLEKAVNPRYCEQLQRSLDFLDAKLASLPKQAKG